MYAVTATKIVLLAYIETPLNKKLNKFHNIPIRIDNTKPTTNNLRNFIFPQNWKKAKKRYKIKNTIYT